jgi:hypothetical protein
MLLELGPEVYSKAQELIAMAAWATVTPEPRRRSQMGAVLTPLPELAGKGAKRLEFWDARWPQFGDDVDSEMRYLRAFSFACWQALCGVASAEEYAWAMSCTDTMQRIAEATHKFEVHMAEITSTQEVLEVLRNVVTDDA